MVTRALFPETASRTHNAGNELFEDGEFLRRDARGLGFAAASPQTSSRRDQAWR